MQRTEVAFYDDLDWTETRTQVPADETLTIALGDREVELELTAEHAAELRQFLAPYLKAGRGTRRRGESPGVTRSVRAGRAAGAAMRDFADASDDDEIWYKRGSTGSYHYSKKLREKFAAPAGPPTAGDHLPAVS